MKLTTVLLPNAQGTFDRKWRSLDSESFQILIHEFLNEQNVEKDNSVKQPYMMIASLATLLGLG